MLVLHRGTDDECVTQAKPKPFVSRVTQLVNQRVHKYTQRYWSTDNPVLHNFCQRGAGLVDELNANSSDILNLHWIPNMVSVADIGRLRKPIVWTLHDMWAFCGGEHYAPDGEDARFQKGYLPANRPDGETGPDLNRRTWLAKCRAWAHQQLTIVSPSCWLAECAKRSILLSEAPIHVIPNPLDTEKTWRPINRDASRTVLNLPVNKKLILFGAHGGLADPRKGADLLRKAIIRVAAKCSGEMELLIYGQASGGKENNWPCPVHWLGVVRDDRVLAQAYSAADVMVVPSRQDNLPNTVIEAHACGTPVAAFNIGGLPDIVVHRETGWLAEAFDTEDLAEGILWLIADETRHAAISVNARKSAEARFSETVVAAQYVELYQHVLAHSDA